jgi:uncharacterized protein Smg (DUF494 family)
LLRPEAEAEAEAKEEAEAQEEPAAEEEIMEVVLVLVVQEELPVIKQDKMVKMVILQEEIKVVEAEAEEVIMEEVMHLNQEEIRLQVEVEEVLVLQIQL